MKRKVITIVLSLAVALTMMPLGAASVFAEGTEEPATPTNVKVQVTDMQQGTMTAFGDIQLTGLIASLAVSFDKSQGADAYWLAAIRKNPPGSTNSWDKMGWGTMPFIKAKSGEKAKFEEGDTGLNGEKITETDKTLTVEMKVCRQDAPTGNTGVDRECYQEGDNITVALQAEVGQYEDYKASEQVQINIPFDEASKGKTFFQDGTSTGGETQQETGETKQPAETKQPVAETQKPAAETTTETKQQSKQDTEKSKKTTKKSKKTKKTKKSNTLTLKKKAKTPVVKYKKLLKKKQVVKRARLFAVSKAQGKMTYKKAGGSKYLLVNKKNGNITVRKGTKPGSYKVKVSATAAGNKSYKKTTKKVTVSIVVRK